MDDAGRWTDSRDDRAWKVRAYWGGGQAMAVSVDLDVSEIPAPPDLRLIEFIGADGQVYRTGMGGDEREADEFSDKELQELLDRARA